MSVTLQHICVSIFLVLFPKMAPIPKKQWKLRLELPLLPGLLQSNYHYRNRLVPMGTDDQSVTMALTSGAVTYTLLFFWFFLVFLVDGLTLSLWLSLAKNYISILTLSYLLLYPILDIFYHKQPLYSTFNQEWITSQADTDLTLFFNQFIQKHTMQRYNTRIMAFGH